MLLATTGQNRAVQDPEPLRRGTLTVAIPADPAGIEPSANRAEPIGSEVIVNLFDTLVSWEGDEDPAPVARIAQSWEISHNGAVYCFRLQPGIRFHDDTPCDAEAVRFSLQRSLRLNGYFRASLATLAAIEVRDPLTIVFRLSRPVPFFLALLAQPQAAIVSPTAVRLLGDAFSSRPVGSGPFRMVTYDPDVSLVLAANQDYFRGPPAIHRLVYLVIADASTRRMMLETGDIDICQQSGQLASLPMEDLEAVRRNPDLQVLEARSQILRQLEFNNLLPDGPTHDLRVRQAMAYAVDYDGLIQGVLDGTVERAYGPLPPGNRAADATLRQSAPRHDPGRARALLAEAGYGRGALHFTLYTFQGSFWATVATFLQANFAAVGIDVTIEQMEFPAFRATHVEGHFQIALDGREAWYNDPDAHLTIGYLSSLATSAMTFRMPKDSQLDGLILEAQSCMDATRRTALYDTLQEQIAQRVPAIYLFSNKVIVFARADVSGLRLLGAPPLCEYWSVKKRAAA